MQDNDVNRKAISFLDAQICEKIERIENCSKDSSSQLLYAKNIHDKVLNIRKNQEVGNDATGQLDDFFHYTKSLFLGDFAGNEVLRELIYQSFDQVNRMSKNGIYYLLLFESCLLTEINEWQYDEMFNFDFIRIVVEPENSVVRNSEQLIVKIFIVPSDYDSMSFSPIIAGDTLNFVDENKDCFEYKTSNYSIGENLVEGMMVFKAQRGQKEKSIPFNFCFTVK